MSNRIRSAARVGGKTMTQDRVLERAVRPLTVPARVLLENELLVLGFRMEMLTVGDGSVSTGTGLGTDFIILEWKGRRLLLRGSELLRAFVAEVDPKAALQFPDEIKVLPAPGR